MSLFHIICTAIFCLTYIIHRRQATLTIMRLLIILSIAWVIRAGVIEEDKKCDGVVINNEYFDVEVLKSELDRPFLLATDYSRNTVYFSYSLNKNDDSFKSAYVNLNTKEFGDIPGINNGFAQTVDQETHNIYVGGSDGVYKYDPKTKKAEFVAGKYDIWSIYYKDNIYFSDFPGQFLYAIVDGQVVKVNDLENTKVDHFILDNEKVFFFTNHTGLYSQKKGTKDAVLYQEFPNDKVRGITMDVHGEVYVCLQDGIYSVDKTTVSLQKVLELDDGFGVAFDNENNFVYSDATNLLRLKPNKKKACI